MGCLAIALAAGFLVLYNYSVFEAGGRDEPGIPLASGTLAFVGVLAIVISRCLKKLETQLLNRA
jgi:hypothetical protein